MKNLVNTYVDKFLHERRGRRHLFTVLTILALVVVTGVFWQLRSTGVAMTNEVYCGLEEHTHSTDDGCYAYVLTCEPEEGGTMSIRRTAMNGNWYVTSRSIRIRSNV